jgi:hypothetical protein
MIGAPSADDDDGEGTRRVTTAVMAMETIGMATLVCAVGAERHACRCRSDADR